MPHSGTCQPGPKTMPRVRSFADLCTRFLRSTDGATAIEYSIIGGMIAVAIVVAATALGTQLNDMYKAVADKVIPPT